MCYWIVFALFYNFGFEGNFDAPGGLYLKGRFLSKGVLGYEFKGLILCIYIRRS